jgi:hypothetical protein
MSISAALHFGTQCDQIRAQAHLRTRRNAEPASHAQAALFFGKVADQTSGPLKWIWTCLKVAIALLLLWGVARLLGLPIEQEILNFLPA